MNIVYRSGTEKPSNSTVSNTTSFPINDDATEDTIEDYFVAEIAENLKNLPLTTSEPEEGEFHDAPEVVAFSTVTTVLPSETRNETDDADDGQRWRAMVDDLIVTISEMESDVQALSGEATEGAEVSRHIIIQLTSLLARHGITVLGTEEMGATENIIGLPFNRYCHQPIQPVLAESTDTLHIAEVVAPGFTLQGKILRRALVRLAVL
jgi:hypothetical protein